MNIGSTTLPDPTTYEISREYRTRETTTINGTRRYSKLTGKRKVILKWNFIDKSYRSSIEQANSLETTQTLNIDGNSFSVVGYSDPVFTILAGGNAYSCIWELREP